MYELIIDGRPWADADGKSQFNYVQSCRLFFDLTKLGHEVEWTYMPLTCDDAESSRNFQVLCVALTSGNVLDTQPDLHKHRFDYLLPVA